MNHSEIEIGSRYTAQVNGNFTTVQVDDIKVIASPIASVPEKYQYHVTNLSTNRKLVFRSVDRFLDKVLTDADGWEYTQNPAVEDETYKQYPDPSPKVGEEDTESPKAPGPLVGKNVKFIGPEYPSCGPRIGDTGMVTAQDGHTAQRVDGPVEELITVNFQGCVKPQVVALTRLEVMEDEQRPDPTSVSSVESNSCSNADATTSTLIVEDKQGTDPLAEKSSPGLSGALVPKTGGETNTARVSKFAQQVAQQPPKVFGQPPHLIVIARAGTGKTTTMVEGVKRMRGKEPSIIPSPQQEAIWEQLMLSSGVRFICCVAFNRDIMLVLRQRLGSLADAKTLHGMGFGAVLKAFPQLRDRELNEERNRDLLAMYLHVDPIQLRKADAKLLKAVSQLVDLCKVNLVGDPSWDGDQWETALVHLVNHFDIELEGTNRSRVFECVPKVLELSRDPLNGGMIGYPDMIWLPVVLKLPVFKYDVLIVDEAQDLNRCQHALIKMAGKRLILCGDPAQAIYGFAGADNESMDRLGDELANEPRGCVTLPLTVTRRCAKSIVAEAQHFVADFEAHESNPDGLVSEAKYPIQRSRGPESEKSAIELKWHESYCGEVNNGDFILCRCNAPLVTECFRFIKAGKKANIMGKEIGQGLIDLIERLEEKWVKRNGGTYAITQLIADLGEWLAGEISKEEAKRNPSQNRITALQDKHSCIMAFTEGRDTPAEVTQRITSVFTDNRNSPGIRLSSIHKAKGLEAHRVFILQPSGIGPREDLMKDWEVIQEDNLRYVARTRAIFHLTYVS